MFYRGYRLKNNGLVWNERKLHLWGCINMLYKSRFFILLALSVCILCTVDTHMTTQILHPCVFTLH